MPTLLREITLTPQLRCFTALAEAVEDLSKVEHDAGIGAHTPHALLRRLVARIGTMGGLVRLGHALIVHDSLQATLVCGGVEVEAEVQCTLRGITNVLLLKEALDQAA